MTERRLTVAQRGTSELEPRPESSLSNRHLPVSKNPQHLIAHVRRYRLSGHCPQRAHREFHLTQVFAAMPAHHHVKPEGEIAAERQTPLKIVSDQFCEFFAGKHLSYVARKCCSRAWRIFDLAR